MKTTFLILCLTLTSSLIAQPILKCSVGATVKENIKNGVVFEFGAGYNANHFIIEGGVTIRPFNLKSGVYFIPNAGYEITINDFAIIPLVGMGYKLRSTDDKSLNGYVKDFGVRFKWKEMFIGYKNTDRQSFISIGVSGFID